MVKRCKILISSLFLLAFWLGVHVCGAQFTENFSDGDFASNPVWTADNATNWTVQTNQLRSNSAVASSTFYITTPSAKATNAQWEFYINLQFNTSSANYIDVYLTSELSDLTSGANNGYFVRIGGTPDEISFYKLTAGVSAILINGVDGITNASNSTLRIKVVRDAANVWQLERDVTGTGSSYVMEGTVTESSFTTSNFFGIRIQQSTASFFNKHFFDDFYAGDIILDSTPPTIELVNAISSTELDVVFNEKVDLSTSQILNNYLVNNSIGNPTTAILQTDEKTVRLTFAQSFPNAVTCQLTVSGVKDLFNNTLTSTNQNFLFFKPVPSQWKDIIITEIFADPFPTVGLPEVEFIEIFNSSEKIFDLQNWKITDGSSIGLLPAHLIFPNQYVILTSTASASQFNFFGAVLGVPNFPTLNNSGDALVLKDNADVSIDNVNYTDVWYRDDDKKQGGFTLELIDPANPCGEEDNWVAAEATTGGTPGTQNSVFANKPDVTGPKLISSIPTSATELTIRFNEKLDDQLPAVTNFTITPTISISQISFTDGSLKSWQLTLSNSLQSGTTYSIRAQNIYDCSGNIIVTDFDSIVFGLPEEADSLDIVINEILFNPRPTGVDFVEVHNNSTKFVNLKNWSVTNYENGLILNAKVITTEDFLLSPDEYIVFTEDNNVVKGEYILAVEENLFGVTDLPSFNDDVGTVALVDPQSNVIDFFSYTDDYHSIFINEDEGVSLERISFATSTNDQANWKSASSTVGFATPGFVNSNVRGEQTVGKITVSPEVFEPVTGQPNFTQIQYNFEQGGYVANVKILDFQGREIKQLVNNATLGTEGFFRWDGDTDEGTKARTGYYVVWVEVFNANGQLDTFRKRVVVASRFK